MLFIILTQEQLKRTLMPVGEYTKDQVREIAEKINTSSLPISRIVRISVLYQMEIMLLLLKKRRL